MEILILIVSGLLSVAFIYFIVRMVCTHSELIRIYKRNQELLAFHCLMGALTWLVFAITLAAMNNTWWHIPYYFVSR